MPSLASRLRSLRRFLRCRGASAAEADDLVQEAVLRLHTYTRAGGEVRNPNAFLIRTALNLAIDAHRRARETLYEPAPIDELNLIDLSPTPDEICAAEQRFRRMKETLDRVNPRTRAVFFMHRLQGFSHAEIAKQLGISVSSVEKHIASAVTLLAIQRQRE
jgi:RNA polymerase sigma-70 factor (ECF subfamily)